MGWRAFMVGIEADGAKFRTVSGEEVSTLRAVP